MGGSGWITQYMTLAGSKEPGGALVQVTIGSCPLEKTGMPPTDSVEA